METEQQKKNRFKEQKRITSLARPYLTNQHKLMVLMMALLLLTTVLLTALLLPRHPSPLHMRSLQSSLPRP